MMSRLPKGRIIFFYQFTSNKAREEYGRRKSYVSQVLVFTDFLPCSNLLSLWSNLATYLPDWQWHIQFPLNNKKFSAMYIGGMQGFVEN